jgi:hypothetical protein
VSVESACHQLARHQLLVPQAIRSLRSRWLQEAGASVGDPALFHARPAS